MSIEKALKDHTTALNRFVDFCEKYGVVPETFGKVVPLSDSAPVISDEQKAPASQVTDVASQVSDSASQVSDEPTATAPVVPESEVNASEENSIEAGVWISQEEEREDGSDVAEAPAVETPAKSVTVSDVADSMKKLLPNRNAIVAVLDQFGVGKITELKAEDLAKAKQLFDQALQGA